LIWDMQSELLTWKSHPGRAYTSNLKFTCHYNSNLDHRLRPECPLILPVCWNKSLHLLSENTEATLYLLNPVCPRVFRHSAQ
jgi:hypothetical protein